MGDLSAECQAKILRLVEDHTWSPVGDPRPRHADVRVLAAAGDDFLARVQRREFRADLYYRLSVVEIRLPPLRERPGDIRELVARFIETANRENHREVEGIDDDALALLCDYPWPGNVRELYNLVTRLVIFKRAGRVSLADLPQHLRERSRTLPVSAWSTTVPPSADDPYRARTQFEADVILQALARTAGPHDAALDMLAMNRAMLAEWLRQRTLDTARR